LRCRGLTLLTLLRAGLALVTLLRRRLALVTLLRGLLRGLALLTLTLLGLASLAFLLPLLSLAGLAFLPRRLASGRTFLPLLRPLLAFRALLALRALVHLFLFGCTLTAGHATGRSLRRCQAGASQQRSRRNGC
jgi:hypothetical protein